MSKIEVLRLGWVANWLIHVLVVLIFLIILQANCFAFAKSDLNTDGTVNFLDFSVMASEWFFEGPFDSCMPDYNSPGYDTNSIDNSPPVVLTDKNKKTFAGVQIAALHGKTDRVVFLDGFDDSTKWHTYVGTAAQSRVNPVFHDKSMKVTGGVHGTYPIIMYRDVPDMNFNACTFRLRYYVQSNAGLNRNS